jgi:hypothetical protein
MDPFGGMGFGLGKWIVDEGFLVLGLITSGQKFWYPQLLPELPYSVF